MTWQLTGNSGTNPATNFLGTTDGRPLVIRTNAVERMRITQGGNVGIGTTSPNNQLVVASNASFGGNTSNTGSEPLEVQGSGAGVSFHDRSGGSTGRWVIYSARTGGAGTETLRFWSSNDKMAITQGGNVGIGTTAPGFRLDVAGAAHASSFPVSSDARLKTDVKPLTNVLEKLEKIRGVSFEWNELCESLGRSTGHTEIGVIAQEVEAVFPELVTTWGDESYRAVDYSRLTGILIESVKELRAENKVLEQRLKALEQT